MISVKSYGTEEYRLHDPFEHKYSDGLARYIDTNDYYDETDGDVEAPTGWFGLAGRNVLVHDSQGFVSRVKFATVEEAKQAYKRSENDFTLWSAGEEYGEAWTAYVSNIGAEYANTADFEETYRGAWDSEKDFAYQLADDIDLFHGNKDSTLERYFDWDAWTRDLFICDYTYVDGYVFEVR